MTGYEENCLLCSIIESPSFMNSLVQFSFQIRRRRCDSVKFQHYKDRGIGMALWRWRAILGSKLSSETANIYEFHVCNEKLQASSHCANVLHIKLAEEWEKEVGIDDWCRRWEVALCRAFETVDDGLIDRALASVGSTASAVILSACQIIAANCGDSSVVLCRGKQAIPLTVDHKSNATRRKRRSSLFDMATDDMVTYTPSVPEEQILHPSPLARETDNSSLIPSLNLSLNPEFEPMEAVASPQETVKEPEESASGPKEFTESAFGSNGYTQMMHAFYPGAYMPVPYAYWPPNAASREEEEDKEAENCNHQILKPIPILPKEPVNLDELVGMSHLSIVETAERRYREPSPLSLKLLGEPSRQSAFHANAPLNRSPFNCGAHGPWSRASSSSSSVDLQPVSSLQSPVTILHSLQIAADPRVVMVDVEFLERERNEFLRTETSIAYENES
ncbi:hypothetical protein Q3G72_014043 [Acer saccharum]|nr:hypothetical protein Q3G72_014043 [Acer saccharum]